MNDEQFLLASAYLDGELTDAERARAEADPVVMAEVDELRALQRLVRDVEPPNETTRNAAVTAALAQFHAGAVTSVGTSIGTASGASSASPAPAPIRFRPRPSYAKYLAVAAGILGVGLLGVAVANLGTGDDDSMDTAAEPAAEEPADEPTEALLADDDTRVADDADEQTSEMAAADSIADEPAAAPAPGEEPASEEPASEAGAERPALEPGQPLTTPEELGSFGTGLLEAQQAGTLGATPNHACPVDDVLGRAEYVVDGVAVPVLVAVDEPSGIVLAVADDTCEPVAEGPIYLP